jgi:hypothetical protein
VNRMPRPYFLFIVGILLVTLIAIASYYYVRSRRARKYPYGRWEDLLKRLKPVNRDNIATVARDLVDADGNRRIDEDPLDLDPSQIWSLVGGLKGLEILEKNCEVLVDLVFYVQQWYPEALSITEQLRQNAREVEFHVGRLRAAAKLGKLESCFPDYAPRAVAIYYTMSRTVLNLYEGADLPGVADIQRAL